MYYGGGSGSQTIELIKLTDKLSLTFLRRFYAKTENEYKTMDKDLLENATITKYPQFLQHVQNDTPRKAEWAVSERSERNLSKHNINTTNYVEVSFRLTKDSQFSRVRAYNLPDLLDIVLDDSVYYATRFLDIGNNRISTVEKSKIALLSNKMQN